MKKLLISTALASLALTGTASAQSLLERVLESTNTQAITGIFANTADNVLAGAVPDVVNIGGTATTEDRTVAAGDVILVNDGSNNVAAIVQADGSLELADGTAVGSVVLGSTVLTDNAGNIAVADENVTLTAAGYVNTDVTSFEVATVTTTVGGDTYQVSGINASVTNILRGLDGPTATTETTQATEAVTALIGNITTTALGAVNTGDIELLGSNQTLTDNIDRASAGTSEAIQQRIDQTITQVGTTASQTVLAINSALNETNVNASVLNTMSGVNATIGRSGFENSLTDGNFTAVATMQADAVAALTGGISTTALGAVNTGTIVSGANDQVGGVVEAIVGNAAVSTN
jgi:hypothetical protein